MPLGRSPQPFSHCDWLFEIKWDGFRALLYSGADGVRLVSRNGDTFKSFPDLCAGLARDLEGLANFGEPTGEFGTVEQTNEDDALVKWDDDGRMRLHHPWLKKVSKKAHPLAKPAKFS